VSADVPVPAAVPGRRAGRHDDDPRWAIPRRLTIIDLSMLALTNVAVLVRHGRILAREAARVYPGPVRVRG
jgi:hypothetical protein